MSVLILYSAVGCWNDYFNAMSYLKDEDLFPLQLFLRNILTSAQSINTQGITNLDMLEQAENGTQQVQFALIVVATVPLLAIYYYLTDNVVLAGRQDINNNDQNIALDLKGCTVTGLQDQRLYWVGVRPVWALKLR